MRTYLLFSLFCLPLALSAQFNGKTKAVDYLNSSNIWVSGVPAYFLDERQGTLEISFQNKEGTLVALVDLSTIEVETVLDDPYAVIIKCQAPDSQCLSTSYGSAVAKTESINLVMHSAFDKGDDTSYKDEYPAKAVRIAEAIEYLCRFYR